MTTAYTSLLGLALPVTGELTGTWGDTVNDSITSLLDTAVAGSATASVASGDWTLTTTDGAANQARAAILIPTGSPGVSRNIIAPSKSKAYIVVNQSNAAVVIKGAATTGVTIASGKTTLVTWNGSDFVEITPAVATNLAPASTAGYVYTSNGGSTAPSFQALSVSGYLPTTGGTMTGLLTTKELALTKTAPSISAGVLTLDCSLSNTFAVSLNASITSFTVSNIPTTGSYYEFNLEFTADGTARTVTWTFSSVAVKWPSGTAPTLTSTNGKKDTFVFYTYDAGTTWLGFVAGQNL